MAAPAIVVAGLAASNTTTFKATANADAVATITNAVLLTGLPATGSQLRTFLSTAFASAAAADTAFRAIGGRIDVRQTGGTASTSTFVVAFSVAGPGTFPSLEITGVGSTDYALEMTVAALQSVSQ